MYLAVFHKGTSVQGIGWYSDLSGVPVADTGVDRILIENPAPELMTSASLEVVAEGEGWAVRVKVDNRPTLLLLSVSADNDHAASTKVNPTRTEVTCPVGTVLTGTLELKKPDGSLVALTESFRLPVRASDGRERVFLAHFKDGSGTVAMPMKESGIWTIDESLVNSRLSTARHMKFAGVVIYTVEV